MIKIQIGRTVGRFNIDKTKTNHWWQNYGHKPSKRLGPGEVWDPAFDYLPRTAKEVEEKEELIKRLGQPTPLWDALHKK